MKTSQSYIARIEGGTVRPSTDALERFAQAKRTRLRCRARIASIARKSGSGAVAVPSCGSRFWEWLDALAGEVDEDFVSAVGAQPEATERPELGKVFG